KLLLQPLRDRGQLAGRLRPRRAVRKPADADDEVDRIARAAPRIAIGGEWQYELDVANGRREAGRQDADDGVLVAIEPDRASGDSRIGAESPYPERLREDDDMIRRRLLVAGLEQAAEPRVRS